MCGIAVRSGGVLAGLSPSAISVSSWVLDGWLEGSKERTSYNGILKENIEACFGITVALLALDQAINVS